MTSKLPVNLLTEIRAGVTTYLTAAYIVIVNPQILSAAGLESSSVMTATCLTTAFGTLLLGLWCKVPYMMAPGMGLNSFFTYGLCINQGVPWEIALGIVFISGALFLLLSTIGLREKIIQCMPLNIKYATSAGIGLFLAFIGFKNMGLIVGNPATLVSLGKFNPPTLIGISTLLLVVLLTLKRIKGAMLISIFVATFIAMLAGLTPTPSQLFSWPPTLAPTFAKLDIKQALSLTYLPFIFTFLFVNLFDSIGTLLGLNERTQLLNVAHKKSPHKSKDASRMGRMLTTDAIATMLGAILGTSTITAYIESASGVAEGGRSGKTALVIAGLFLLTLFIAPLVSSIPAYAVAPILVLVGFYMMTDIKKIELSDFTEAIPAFLVVLLMPLSFSIANGLLFGFASYLLIKLFAGKGKELNRVTVVIGILSILNLLIIQ